MRSETVPFLNDTPFATQTHKMNNHNYNDAAFHDVAAAAKKSALAAAAKADQAAAKAALAAKAERAAAAANQVAAQASEQAEKAAAECREAERLHTEVWAELQRALAAMEAEAQSQREEAKAKEDEASALRSSFEAATAAAAGENHKLRVTEAVLAQLRQAAGATRSLATTAGCGAPAAAAGAAATPTGAAATRAADGLSEERQGSGLKPPTTSQLPVLPSLPAAPGTGAPPPPPTSALLDALVFVAQQQQLSDQLPDQQAAVPHQDNDEPASPAASGGKPRFLGSAAAGLAEDPVLGGSPLSNGAVRPQQQRPARRVEKRKKVSKAHLKRYYNFQEKVFSSSIGTLYLHVYEESEMLLSIANNLRDGLYVSNVDFVADVADAIGLGERDCGWHDRHPSFKHNFLRLWRVFFPDVVTQQMESRIQTALALSDSADANAMRGPPSPDEGLSSSIIFISSDDEEEEEESKRPDKKARETVRQPAPALPNARAPC